MRTRGHHTVWRRWTHVDIKGDQKSEDSDKTTGHDQARLQPPRPPGNVHGVRTEPLAEHFVRSLRYHRQMCSLNKYKNKYEMEKCVVPAAVVDRLQTPPAHG